MIPRGCVSDEASGRVDVLLAYSVPSAGGEPTLALGRWDGESGRFLGDISTDVAPIVHFSRGTAFVETFAGELSVSFFDEYAAELLAREHRELSLGRAYSLETLFENSDLSLPSSAVLVDVAGDGLRHLEMLVLVESTLELWTIDAAPWNNRDNHLDVTKDGNVSPLDALVVINQINLGGSRLLIAGEPLEYYYDTNGDNVLGPLDALVVINELNRRSQGEGEPSIDGSAWDVLYCGLWNSEELFPGRKRLR